MAHWSPGSLPEGVTPGLRETVQWNPRELTPPTDDDEINTSLTYGFIFDFCAVEIDRITGEVRIDKYVTMHDGGRLLNPALVESQVHGALGQAFGATLYENFAYGPDGNLLTGTFADYLLPTAMEIPPTQLLHQETPSPFTPLGTKGVGEGNSMTTPACVGNAVADALGIRDVPLPITPVRIAALLHGDEPPPPRGSTRPPSSSVTAPPPKPDVAQAPDSLWHRLFGKRDPA